MTAAPGLAFERRRVRDLWPLGLMRERAGRPAPEVDVVVARSEADVAAALAWARERGVKVVPVGAATGVCGAVDVEEGQLALDLSRLDQVLDLDEKNLVVRVGAGIVAARLEDYLNARGLTLGHQPSSLPVSTLGGLVATRSSGQESTRHGNIEDLLLGARALLADGTVLEPLPGPRSAVGPPLTSLLVGSEGALAVILELVLRIRRLPAATEGTAYRFAGVEQGLDWMRAVVQAGLRPLVMRLYDAEDTLFQGISDGGCLAVVATCGEPEVAAAEAAVVRRLAAGADELGAGPWERWRAHRYSLSAERLRDLLEPAGAFVDTIELAAPWTRLVALHSAVKTVLGEQGFALCHFSHAYEQGACAYFSFAGSGAGEAEAEAAYTAAWRGALEAAVAAGATVSHHHGVGQVRAGWAEREMKGWWQVWERVRAGLDPAGTLNPRALGGQP